MAEAILTVVATSFLHLPPVSFSLFSNSEALPSAPGSVFQSMTVTVDRFCSLPGLLSQTDDLKGLVDVWVCVAGEVVQGRGGVGSE